MSCMFYLHIFMYRCFWDVYTYIDWRKYIKLKRVKKKSLFCKSVVRVKHKSDFIIYYNVLVYKRPNFSLKCISTFLAICLLAALRACPTVLANNPTFNSVDWRISTLPPPTAKVLSSFSTNLRRKKKLKKILTHNVYKAEPTIYDNRRG